MLGKHATDIVLTSSREPPERSMLRHLQDGLALKVPSRFPFAIVSIASRHERAYLEKLKALVTKAGLSAASYTSGQSRDKKKSIVIDHSFN